MDSGRETSPVLTSGGKPAGTVSGKPDGHRRGVHRASRATRFSSPPNAAVMIRSAAG
jgi:hypothetical protein